MSCGCNDNFDQLNITSIEGIGIVGVTTSTPNPGFITITLTLSNGGTLAPFDIPNGVNGVDGQPIDHTSFTSSNTAPFNLANLPGAIDTYTVWGDVGETMTLGTFTVYNGIDSTAADSVDNVGAGVGIYKVGTVAPFSMKTLKSSNSDISIVASGANEVDINMNNGSWYECLPAGFVSATNPVFTSNPAGGGFTAVNNFANLNSLAFRKNLHTKKIEMKGVIQFSGGSGINYAPTGTTLNEIIEICEIPAQFQCANPLTTSIGTCFIAGTGASSVSSACQFYISSNIMYLVVCNRTNEIKTTSKISFESSSYSNGII
jgi:hypothetical protein